MPKLKEENRITESYTKCYTEGLLDSTLDVYKIIVLKIRQYQNFILKNSR